MFKTRLNGIGFAQGLEARINAQHQLEIVDISLQSSLLALARKFYLFQQNQRRAHQDFLAHLPTP